MNTEHLTDAELVELESLLAQQHSEQDDEDAVTIYCSLEYINGCTVPDFWAMEALPVYQRGRELYEQKHPPLPAHEDPRYQRSTSASLHFETAFGREPRNQDILRYSDIEAAYSSVIQIIQAEHFIDAWSRHLPEMPCPVKVDGERVLRRMKPERTGGVESWEENIHQSPIHNWGWVEHSAGVQHIPGDVPAINAVVFLGVVEGKHKCRPATADEEQNLVTESETGVIGILRRAVERDQAQENQTRSRN